MISFSHSLSMIITFIFCYSHPAQASSYLDNGVIGVPEVNCMEDRVKLTFRTEQPFTGRIFVKGMIAKDQCVRSFSGNTKSTIDFQMNNGQCNMRRSRKVGPEQKGVEQSITVIISFHNTFITKVDRAYRCTCFYMEADKVVTSRFDVSMLPTTDLIDTARMPLCTYTVRRASVTGSPVSFATVGEPVFHVWQCESDMFSMLVHSCFVDDGNGQDRKPLIDENGCSIDEALVPNLTYNPDKNMAFSEVSVFKFADKVSTYFQCAVSTCMNSEGMCQSKTPPRCGSSPTRFEKDEQDEPEADDTFDPYQQHVHRRARSVRTHPSLITQQSNHSNDNLITFKPSRSPFNDANTMDLSANPIVVLDLDENTPQDPADTPKFDAFANDRTLLSDGGNRVCFSSTVAILLIATFGLSVMTTATIVVLLSLKRIRSRDKISIKN